MRPMLATARAELPHGQDWSYEFKWDGIRALVDVSTVDVGPVGSGTTQQRRRTTITTRNGNDVTVTYPELASIGADLDDALLDAEIVALADGIPSFERLQQRMNVTDAAAARALAATSPVALIVFDVLRLYGVDVPSRPLWERRQTLTRLIENHPDSAARFSLSPSFDDPAAVQLAAQQFGLEGVVAKRSDSRYAPGARTGDWIKVKFVRRAEFVVIGWESALPTPATLSSLVLGYYDDLGRLRLAGKVGSGLSGATARALQRELLADEAPDGIELDPSTGRIVHWVTPRTVVEVSYSQWSSDAPDARLRHPVFVGIRRDKDASEVTRDE